MLRLDGIIYTVINLIVLYLLMRHFLIKPIQKVIDARAQLIDGQFAQAKEVQAKADESKAEYEEKLKMAEAQSKEIIEAGKVTAKNEYEHAVQTGKEDADQLRRQAKQEISLERDKTLEEIQSQIAMLAVSISEKVLASEQNGQQDMALYNQFLKEAGGVNEADRM